MRHEHGYERAATSFRVEHDKPGIILDYDDRGDLVSLEILDASRRVTEARKVEFQMAE